MRRHRAEKRQVVPDPKFNSDLISRFVSIIMVEGKKTTAERIVYSALDILKEKSGEENPAKALNKAIGEIAQAIDRGDTKYLKTLPGIGEQKAKEILQPRAFFWPPLSSDGQSVLTYVAE